MSKVSSPQSLVITPTGEALINVKTIAAKLCLSESRVWEIVKDPAMQFPRRIPLGSATRWSLLEFEAWLEVQKQERWTRAREPRQAAGEARKVQRRQGTRPARPRD